MSSVESRDDEHDSLAEDITLTQQSGDWETAYDVMCASRCDVCFQLSLHDRCLARPEALKLCLATVALFVSSFSYVLLPTFAGKVINIVTTKPDTDQGCEATLKAVNETILLIVAVILIGKLSCFQHPMLSHQSS